MATYTIRNNTTQDWRDTAMSKAQFEALASERRTNRAGSGFDEWGKHNFGTDIINEGLWTHSSFINTFGLGRLAQNGGIGTSKTESPISSINGVSIKINGTTSDFTTSAYIPLPIAPTVLPSTATLTQEQIDSGVIKHADASNSGLIVNGKFDTDTSGWSGYSTTILQDAGRMKVTLSTANWGSAYQEIGGLVVGKKYILECQIELGTATSAMLTAGSGNQSTIDLGSVSATSNGRYTLEFIPTDSTVTIGLFITNTTAGMYAYFDNIAVFPSDAISRSDLVFLESWHEDVSEKDFVYPLGNVQYLGTTGDAGTTVAGAFAGSATYSLFSDTWQADGALVGKGYIWSTLSDANKKAFVANPENNCYLDGDKVIQVRYRIRVVAGWGDSWTKVDPNTSSEFIYYSSEENYITVKGKQTSISKDLNSYTSYIIDKNVFSTISRFDVRLKENGVGVSHLHSLVSSQSYDTFVFYLPIALVHRRNQGAYHPVYNPNGSGQTTNADENDWRKWYNTDKVAISIAQMFTNRTATNSGIYSGWASGPYIDTLASGAIGSPVPSGRPDGLFYDQIHEGDITDLRMSSKKVEDYNRLIDREFNKLVAGTYRGTEGEFEIVSFVGNLADGGSGFKAATFKKNINSATHVFIINHTKATSGASRFLKGDWIQQSLVTGSNLYANYGEYTGAVASILNKVNFNGAQHSIGDSVTIYASIPSTRTKSNTLTHTDIIGSPANYPTAWKTSGVSGVPLIVAEDGTSMLPTGALTTFKLSRKANATPLQVLKSTDSGATWAALTVTTHYTFNTTTNVLTMVTAPATTDLIMVTYQTHTSMAVPAVNSEVLAIGDVESHSFHSYMQVLLNSLIGKINTNALSSGAVNHNLRLSTYSIVAGKLETNSYDTPIQHPNINMIAVSSPVVKVFPYLTRSNGKAYLNLVFKEMKYNGTSWGDNNKFNIVDNVSTTTDDNGATVLIGQKRVPLPYFIGQGE